MLLLVKRIKEVLGVLFEAAQRFIALRVHTVSLILKLRGAQITEGVDSIATYSHAPFGDSFLIEE